MIRKVLAGAALATAATAATVGAAGIASAHTGGPTAETMTNAHEANQAARAAAGETAYGTGATEFATDNGDVAIAGDPGGVANSYGAPFAHVDLRCAVPAAQGVGGNVLGGPVAACTNEPVDQFDAPERIL
ncbi:hypothetical protein G3I40_42925 [Streptomyces sp. SID14478]|uniref:hypothetical protein n=1 Tax=Streptomyces sp. SID14478 TaxID=2706073 RepID=UPI0013DE8940|nr:hypothetical protein [Streptomyces sp. SID14478]NEB81923.1 hypothetical protein [Streptomyces sp. SID14478]